MSEDRKVGRRSIYTEELGDYICHKIATTTIATYKLCEMEDRFPCENAIYEWRIKFPTFGEKYAQAKMRQAELSAEKILEYCEVPTFVDEKGITRIDSGRVAAQRLLVDSIKWQASKLAPKIYGDRTPEASNSENRKEVSESVAKLLKENEKEY